MTEEYRQALEDLNVKRAMYDIADEDYEEVAYHELKAAEARVMALIKEQKSDEMLVFDKELFRKNAPKNIIKMLSNHIDAVDEKEVTFKNGDKFGIAEYEFDGEERYLYPVKKEWCRKEGARSDIQE